MGKLIEEDQAATIDIHLLKGLCRICKNSFEGIARDPLLK